MMTRFREWIFLVLAIVIVDLANGNASENWMQWRGPTADGVAGMQARPPLHWDLKTNIAWIAELPGEGSATPIVLENQVFVLSAEKTQRKSPKPVSNDTRAKTIPDEFFYRYIVTSFDRNTGERRWQKIATEQVPHEGRHETHTNAAGSPTTDGERLYASFGSRGIFCYSIDGELIWQVDLGDMRTRYGWGEAVTPVLAGELLIVNWDQEEDSYLIALDKRTGETVWRTERPGEVTSWNTPLVTEFNGKSIIVVNGTGSAKAYDAGTGEVLWACGGQTTNAIPSPIRFQDTVICMSGYRDAFACAIPLDSRGDITGNDLLRWKVKQGTPYVPSPIVSKERLFFTAGNTDVLSCIDARTGKSLLERKRLAGVTSLYASPMLANGHLFFVGRGGTTVVIKDNESLDMVSVNELNDAIDASPVAVDNQLFLRGWKKLYCLQESSSGTK
ncbi:MAG: PQQ-binding-like beta-propeller repeat protein [Pirellulaceae bacterium]|nr:PQQ-binding-like beta-propeller repeat protein [Pirellulaceae bacterium]